jgi:hypothetical protein
VLGGSSEEVRGASSEQRYNLVSFASPEIQLLISILISIIDHIFPFDTGR